MTSVDELMDMSDAIDVVADQKPEVLTLGSRSAAHGTPPKGSPKAAHGRVVMSEAQTRAIDNLCRRRDNCRRSASGNGQGTVRGVGAGAEPRPGR